MHQRLPAQNLPFRPEHEARPDGEPGGERRLGGRARLVDRVHGLEDEEVDSRTRQHLGDLSVLRKRLIPARRQVRSETMLQRRHDASNRDVTIFGLAGSAGERDRFGCELGRASLETRRAYVTLVIGVPEDVEVEAPVELERVGPYDIGPGRDVLLVQRANFFAVRA